MTDRTENQIAVKTLNEMKRVAKEAIILKCNLNMNHYIYTYIFAGSDKDFILGGEFTMQQAVECNSVCCFAGWCATDQYFADKFHDYGDNGCEPENDINTLAGKIHDGLGDNVLGLLVSEYSCLFDSYKGARRDAGCKLALDPQLHHINGESTPTLNDVVDVLDALIARREGLTE